MQVTHVFIHAETGRNNAEIDVPGLGIVKIANVLSEETLKRIEAEAITAMRIKLGQKIVAE